MTGRVVIFKVQGIPGPQGSKSFKGVHAGRGVMVESSAKVKPWREAVKWAAYNARGSIGFQPLEGPLEVTMIFALPRPSSAPKRVTRPAKKPDLSKLVRSTEDAITDAGLWRDDAQVVVLHCGKHFPDPDPDNYTPDVPGVWVRIAELAGS